MSLLDNFVNGTLNSQVATIGNYIGAGAAATGTMFNLLNSAADTGVSTPGLVRDINTNGFLASKSVYVPRYFIRAFDEPTYLTFKLEFLFHQSRNALYTDDIRTTFANNTVPYSKAGDTEHGYDYLPEAFLEDGMLAQNDRFATVTDPNRVPPSYVPELVGTALGGIFGSSNILNHQSYTQDQFVGYYYSAEDYLGLNRGEYGRARLMRKIKMILLDLQENFPYYMKSIEGLDTLNKINPKAGFRVEEDAVITIKCYEGIDLKITQLIQMIRKVTWDDVYQRWVLPDIMRYFGMRIYVSEIRTFHEMSRSDIVHFWRHIPKLTVFNYTEDQNGELRNATESRYKHNLYQQIMNVTSGILTAAQALGNTFFGETAFQNIINQAGNLVGTVSDISGSLAQAYQTMCISAINEVMPTICYECHMCEFDISDTMSEMGSLQSTSGDPQEQVLRIKVRQVEDFQVYPLDRNLATNEKNSGYTLDNRIYGTTEFEDSIDNGITPNILSNDDSGNYAQKRADGFTGTTVFADRVFDERFNGAKRSMFDKAASTERGVNQTLLYRNLASLYDEEVKSYFVNRGFNMVGDVKTDAISPRAKMYPGNRAQELMHSTKGALRYKRNSMDAISSVLTLLVNGLNAASSISNANYSDTSANTPFSTFSRATSYVTEEDLATALPEIYVATQTLRHNISQALNTQYGDTNAGIAALMDGMAFSKATHYNAMGAVANLIENSLLQGSHYVGNSYNGGPLLRP